MLVAFIECSKQHVRTVDESPVIATTLRCREDLWQLPMVLGAIHNGNFENPNVGAICRLLSCTAMTAKLSQQLAALLKRGSPALRLHAFPHLIARLQKDGFISTREVFLPRLGLFSPIELWETAISAFYLCEPSLLSDKRLWRVPRMRSARCRVLLDILLADLAGDLDGPASLLGKGVQGLKPLGRRDHGLVLMRLCRLSMFKGGRLPSALIRVMVTLGDNRDLNVVHAAASVNSQKLLNEV